VAFAFTLILQFNHKQVTLTKQDIVDRSEFSALIYRFRVTEQPVVNTPDKLVITKPIKFAYAHLILLNEAPGGYGLVNPPPARDSGRLEPRIVPVGFDIIGRVNITMLLSQRLKLTLDRNRD